VSMADFICRVHIHNLRLLKRFYDSIVNDQ
jgi:hypothetical protein